jgi:hypothetical protein
MVTVWATPLMCFFIYFAICWGFGPRSPGRFVMRITLYALESDRVVAPWEPDHSWISTRFQYYDPMLELENRNNAQPRRSAAPREFFLPVEVYISNQAAAALRKVHLIYQVSICHLLLIHGTAKPTEEGREERLFETSLHVGRR